MKDKLLEQAKHEYKPIQRAAALVVLAPIFLILLPLVLATQGAKIDRGLNLPPILFGFANLVLALLLVGLGLFFAMWSIYAQFTLGRGTPVPLMATQKLIVQPPFTYCRNPMTLGTILMYLGVSVVVGSIGAAILVLVFAGLLLLYIQRVEEKEMELRFGQEYLEYRRQTPFLLPRFRRQG